MQTFFLRGWGGFSLYKILREATRDPSIFLLFGRSHDILLLAVEYTRAQKKNIICKELVTNVGSELTLQRHPNGFTSFWISVAYNKKIERVLMPPRYVSPAART
jgi:hypothetical protein